MGALIVAWFSKREQPYINTIFAAVTFLGIGAGMLVTVGAISLVQWLVEAMHLALMGSASSPRRSFGWLSDEISQELVSAEGDISGSAPLPRIRVPSRRALTMPVVWTLALGAFAISWVYNMYFSFVPLFLESERGISLQMPTVWHRYFRLAA